MEIPKGNSRDDIKARRQIIKDLYAKWISEHPDKKVWNKSLKAYIHIKYQSINETLGYAPLSYEATEAILHLTDLLSNARVIVTRPAKNNDKNQRRFTEMVLLVFGNVQLLVGKQRTTKEYVQYCITKKQR
jgi:hypothetical protein